MVLRAPRASGFASAPETAIACRHRPRRVRCATACAVRSSRSRWLERLSSASCRLARNPPDPTWIPGFWDDADFDDAIVRIVSTSGASETGWLSMLAPHGVPIYTVSAADDRHHFDRAFAPYPPRGPPVARASAQEGFVKTDRADAAHGMVVLRSGHDRD